MSGGEGLLSTVEIPPFAVLLLAMHRLGGRSIPSISSPLSSVLFWLLSFIVVVMDGVIVVVFVVFVVVVVVGSGIHPANAILPS